MSNAVQVVEVASAEEVLHLAGRALGRRRGSRSPSGTLTRSGRSVQDWHWAHNDPERAAGGPFGGPIAHAHMTLALAPHFREELVPFASGECMFYGYNRVRFPTAVPVGARLRAHGAVVQVDQIPGGEQLTIDLRVEIEGHERPACAAQAIWRHYDLGLGR